MSTFKFVTLKHGLDQRMLEFAKRLKSVGSLLLKLFDVLLSLEMEVFSVLVGRPTGHDHLINGQAHSHTHTHL